MFKNHFTSILLILSLCMFLCACTTAPQSTAPSGDVLAGQTGIQGNVDDDLEAILEEAVLTLSTNVSDMISKVNNLGTPEGKESDKYNQYLEFKRELEDLDQRIDELDDTIESNYRDSKISDTLFEKLHRELDSFEELIDSAEAKVEHLFGYED